MNVRTNVTRRGYEKNIALTSESVAMTNGLAHTNQRIDSNADKSDDEDASYPVTKKLLSKISFFFKQFVS